MTDVLLLAALVFALAFGFALLALSQGSHWRAAGGSAHLPRPAVIALRILGFSLLSLGLIVALLRDGGGFGALLWVCLLSLAAFATTAAVSFYPRCLRGLASATAAFGMAFGKMPGERDGPERSDNRDGETKDGS